MANKVNPRRRPVNQADMLKALEIAKEEAVGIAFTIFFTVLLDKHNASKEELHVFWDEVNELSDAITEGYVSINDLKHVLATEYEIGYRR